MLPTELWALYICRWECAAAKARHYHGMQIERVLGANLDMSISRLNRSRRKHAFQAVSHKRRLCSTSSCVSDLFICENHATALCRHLSAMLCFICVFRAKIEIAYKIDTFHAER